MREVGKKIGLGEHVELKLARLDKSDAKGTQCFAINTGICKTRTGWLRMADGKMRMEKCGWKNADDKIK